MVLMSSLIDFVAPDTCRLCGGSLGRVWSRGVCDGCWEELPVSVSRVSGPSTLIDTFSLGPYEGRLGELVCHSKYGSKVSLVDALGCRLGDALNGSVDVDVVTFVSIPRVRRWRRGFDQGERLARAVSGRLGIPFERLLLRKPGLRQVGKGAEERRRLQASDFRVRGVELPGRILLIDDVRTTGASLNAAASALIEGGATSIWAATVCHQDGKKTLQKV